METFWVTKYALSGGIFTVESTRKTEEWHKPGEYYIKDTRPSCWGSFSHKEAFDNVDDAVADANDRRARKIASLRKQIAKLEKLSFAWTAPPNP